MVLFPSLGGVAVAKRLTGWSRRVDKKDGTKRRQFPIPLLRRGGSREATDGVVGPLPAHPQENHPGGSAATPPKEGNFAKNVSQVRSPTRAGGDLTSEPVAQAFGYDFAHLIGMKHMMEIQMYRPMPR